MKGMNPMGSRVVWAGILAVAPLAGAEAQPQPQLVAGRPVGGQLPLTLQTRPARMYRWETSPGLGPWAGLALASPLPLLAPGSAMNLSVPISPPRGFFRVKETAPFEPAWSEVKPLRVIPLLSNPSASALVNGAALRTAMLGLIAGDRLEIAPGTYSIQSFTNLTLQGTAQMPIWITAPQGGVTITRPDAQQNLLNLGMNAPLRYLAFEGIDFTGGSMGFRLGDCRDLWIDRCTFSNFDSSAISANSNNTSNLYITRNEISGTLNGGDGISVGANDGSIIATNCVFALNHVHHTAGQDLGEGIEIKRGSWGNLVSGNVVHDLATVAIFVGPGSAAGLNVVENNVCYAAGDSGIMVNSHCLVRNNLSIGNRAEALNCSVSSALSPTQVTVVHNTFIGSEIAVRLGSWNTGTNLVFANNACYSQNANAIYAPAGTGTAVFAGLVTFGPVASGIPIAAAGTGLADFANVTWTGTARDATPSAASPLRNAAAPAHLTEYDLNYFLRTLPPSSGSCR